MVYTDLNRRDTLGYEWLLACCCHLIVCLDVLIDGLEDYGYDHYYITLIMMLIILLVLVSWHVIVYRCKPNT
jgi:hypothetical protein